MTSDELATEYCGGNALPEKSLVDLGVKLRDFYQSVFRGRPEKPENAQ